MSLLPDYPDTAEYRPPESNINPYKLSSHGAREVWSFCVDYATVCCNKFQYMKNEFKHKFAELEKLKKELIKLEESVIWDYDERVGYQLENGYDYGHEEQMEIQLDLSLIPTFIEALQDEIDAIKKEIDYQYGQMKEYEKLCDHWFELWLFR